MWRKRAGVEPTQDCFAAPTGFEVRPAHRDRISSAADYDRFTTAREAVPKTLPLPSLPGSGSPTTADLARSARSPAKANHVAGKPEIPTLHRQSRPRPRAIGPTAMPLIRFGCDRPPRRPVAPAMQAESTQPCAQRWPEYRFQPASKAAAPAIFRLVLPLAEEFWTSPMLNCSRKAPSDT